MSDAEKLDAVRGLVRWWRATCPLRVPRVPLPIPDVPGIDLPALPNIPTTAEEILDRIEDVVERAP